MRVGYRIEDICKIPCFFYFYLFQSMIPSMSASFQLPIHLGYNYMREGLRKKKKKAASDMIDSFTSRTPRFPPSISPASRT
jgi:hypothetical protein